MIKKFEEKKKRQHKVVPPRYYAKSGFFQQIVQLPYTGGKEHSNVFLATFLTTLRSIHCYNKQGNQMPSLWMCWIKKKSWKMIQNTTNFSMKRWRTSHQITRIFFKLLVKQIVLFSIIFQLFSKRTHISLNKSLWFIKIG